MMKKSLGVLLSSVVLLSIFAVLILFSSQAISKENEAVYKVLNPESWLVPYKAHALAPRLSTLEGKTIAIISAEGPAIQYLKESLLEAVPKIKKIYYVRGTCMGWETCPPEDKKKLQQDRPDAVIQGIGH